MVLSKAELIESLQNEVRILQHLMTKVEPKMLGYRPTAKQRSMIELLRYLSFMGPTLISACKTGEFDAAAWSVAEKAAAGMDFEQLKGAIAKQSGVYAELLGGFSDSDLRVEQDTFGKKAACGAHIVNVVLGPLVAYRMQLFLYLKSCGREELNTYNLWVGEDGSMPASA